MMGHKKKGSESSPMKAQMEAGSGDKEEEQDLHHDSEYTSWEEIVQSDAEEEDVEEWSMEEGVNEFMATEQVDEETLNLAAGLASRSSGELEQALHQFLTLLATPKGSKLLLQYVLASPQCVELVSAWEAGAGATTTAVPLMLVLSQLLRHPIGKGQWTGGSGRDLVPKKCKGLMVVQARLDKLARSIVRTRMKDIYSHLSSSQRSRQKAALRLMASIVLRGRLLAVEVATTFDFTLQALRKIGKASRAPLKKGLSQGLLSQTTRSYFIEFALSFLVVGDPGLLRWVLQKRPLYASVLHGLASDDESTIIEVLYVLQQKVLSDAALVPAGLQSALFGDVALEQLAQIVADDQLGDSKEIAYGMLMSLCTNPAHGLCPESASAWGPPPGAKTGAFGGGQGRLLRFMRRLQAIKVVQHREILLATARATPRLAAAYLDSVPFSVEPQPAPVWFVAMVIVVELISIASTPPPFPAMAQQGVPPPRMEGPLIQSSLRRLFPRALSKVTFNRGLQHASVLVRHGSLRVLLEALLSLERLLDAATLAVDENLYKKIPAERSEMGFGDDWLVPESLSGQGSVVQETNVKKIQSRGSSDDVTSHNKEAESSGTVVDNLKGREVSRKQWLQLAESIQTTMWAALPDPNVLLLMLSMLRKVDTEVKSIAVKGCHKRSHVVDSDKPPSKRRRKEKGKGSVTHISSDSESDSSSSSIESEDQLDSEEMITLAQIWGDELILGSKVTGERVLPVAFTEKGFDPFRLLPSSPADISRSQQEAILALLLATTGSAESFCIPWVHSSSSNMKAAGVTLSLIYKHAKPLLTLLVSLDSGKMRNQAYVVASCVLLSTGAFESNTHEVTFWLDHLLMLEGRSSVHNSYSPENMDSEVPAPQFLGTVVGESVVEFLTRVVLDVGRGLYKYLDQLYSLLSAHTLKESSSDHYNQGPGITAPKFGSFVVCALEHTLRVARSAMPRPQQAAISLYVSGVLHHLLQTQVNAQALAIVITSLLSADLPLGKPSGAADPRSSQAEWSPLWALLLQAHTVLSLDKDDPLPLHIGLSETMMHHDGQLAAVIESCQKIEEEEVGVTEKGLELASAILCAMPQEVLKNFSLLVEMCAKIFRGNFPVLINVVVVYHGLLSEVVEQAIDQGLLLDTAATVMKGQKTEVVSPVSMSRKHSTSMDFFLRVLPFPVLFQAAVCSHAGKLLMSELMSSFLEDAATRIKLQDRPIAMRLILTWIHRLAALSPDGLDEQLHKCFGLLQYVVLLPKEWNMDGGGESDCSEHSNDERIMVCNNMVCESLAHAALSNSMQTGMWASSLNLQDPKRQRSRRALTHHTLHYLKSLIQMSTSWDPHGKSTAVSAKQLLQLQAKIATACRAYVGRAIAAVQMEEFSGILDDFQFGDANSSASSSFLSSVVELALYAEPQVLLHFLLLLFSRIVWSSEGKRMWTSASLVNTQSLLDIYRIVMKITLKEEDPLEAGGHCLLSALRLAPVAAMGLYSSQTVAAQLPQLISFTPIEVIHHCVRSPSKVRAEIALLLVQASQIHMAEFGRLLVAGTTDRGEVDGVSLVHVGLASKFLTAAGDLSPMSKVSLLSDSDLLLLLPAAQAYLVRSLREPANDMAHHVATAYWVLLTKRLRTWDKFVMEYLQESSCNVLEISGSSLGSAMQEPVKMLQQCLGICNVSVKKQLALLHQLLPKDGIPLGFLDLKSPNYSEADLFMQLLKVYAKAAVVKVLLWNVLQVLCSDKKPDIQVEEEEEEKQKVAPFHMKKDKKRQATADVCTKYTSTIVTTLGMIFKQVNQEMGSASSCDSRLQMVSILEEYLLTQLSEIVQMLDVTQFQPTIILLLESFAKTALRFRFGKPMVMKALQALAMHLHHSAATQEHELGDVRDAAVHVLDLVIAHSQFVPLLLSCSSAPKKLPLNLGRHAGKGTVLSSLPSILSLIGSPLVVCLSNDDTSSSSSSGVTGSHGRVHDVEEQGLRAAAYDPAFILPFALHGISEGCINTEEFVHLGLLAVALVSISSSDDVLRKLGYEVLAGYLAALEDGPSFKGKPQIHLLLMYVKNTVTEIWQQLPYVLVLFAAEASCILMHPENPHYPIITRYLLRGPGMDLEVLRKAARIGPCAQALVEHAGFLPWLVSTAVNLRESTTWELQDSKDASDMAAMVLEVMIENVLRWRFVEKCGLGEGMEELTTVALELHRFLTPHGDDTTPKLHVVFRRPTIRIITFVLRASQRRKTHQTHFTLTLSGLLEMIQWSEAEGVDTGYKVETTQETRVLALLLLLHNSPPADKQLLYQIASWAVPVAVQMMSPDAHREDFHRHIMGQAESGKNIDSICEKLLRWLVASLVLGKKAMEVKNHKRSAAATTMAPETPSTCWSVLMHDLSYQIVADSSASINWRLASLMVELQKLVPGDSSLGSLITALTALWPFNKLLSEQEAQQQGEENWCVVVHLLQFLLSNLPVPQETNSLWRWSFNSPWRSNLNSEATKTIMKTPMQSSVFESEIRQSLLTVLQQLLLGGGGISCTHLADLVSHWKAGLANTVSNLGFETSDHQSRLEVTRDSAMDNLQRRIQEILQRHSY
ncbi:unnamed protein product [Sphagnum compactum]